MSQKIWMKISDDKYQLPECVADSCKELAAMLGIPVGRIHNNMSRHRTYGLRALYVAVEVEDDDEV